MGKITAEDKTTMDSQCMNCNYKDHPSEFEQIDADAPSMQLPNRCPECGATWIEEIVPGPEASPQPEAITPDALEREPGWVKDENELRLTAIYVMGEIRVLFLSNGTVSVYSGLIKAKGVTTMPELRMLCSLINGTDNG